MASGVDASGVAGTWTDDLDVARALDEALSDRDWSQLPPNAVRSMFSAPSGRLALFSLGDPEAPRVVLVPGATGSKEDFILMAPLLVSAGYFVQSYDLAGQYQSANAGADREHYNYELFVADMVAVLESGAPAHLLGYSFAGIIAEMVVASRPELVRSLTLLATPPRSGDVFRSVRWIGLLGRFASSHVGAGLMIWGVRTNKNKVSPGRLAFVRHRFRSTTRSSVDDIIGLMKHTPDLRAELAASGCPKLVAVGDHDLWATGLYLHFAEEIGARVSVYRTGHSPCETAPHQLAADMLRLFERGG